MWDVAAIYYCIMMTQSFNLLGLSLIVWIGSSFSHRRVLLLLLELVPVQQVFGAQASFISSCYFYLGLVITTWILIRTFFSTNEVGMPHTYICSKAYL